jgi:hypothetical protein
MKPTAGFARATGRRSIIGLGLMVAAGFVSASSRATAQQAFVVKPVTEKKLKQLPAGPLYWRVENFPTLALAQAAEGPTSLAADVAGKAWLFTLGPKGGATKGGSNAIEIGPIPEINAPEYLLRINYAEGLPGAKTRVHTHPGSETFYVLSGKLGQQTPQGQMYVGAGQSMPGHGRGMPMQVSSSGTGDMTALVMFVVDATKPFSSPAKFQ